MDGSRPTGAFSGTVPEWRVPHGGAGSPGKVASVAQRRLSSGTPCDFAEIGRLRGPSSPPDLEECDFDKRFADLQVTNQQSKKEIAELREVNAELREVNADLRSGLRGVTAVNTKLERENAKLRELVELLLSRRPEEGDVRAASV